MTRTVNAIYENGLLRPLEPLEGLADRTHVRVTVEIPASEACPLAGCVGTMPDDDAEEMRQIVEREFERVRPDDW